MQQSRLCGAVGHMSRLCGRCVELAMVVACEACYVVGHEQVAVG